MNAFLWIPQVGLAFAFFPVGAFHAFPAQQVRWRPGMEWIDAVPRRLMTFIGVCEMAAAVALIVPGLTGFARGGRRWRR
jgi:hypothetical protein